MKMKSLSERAILHLPKEHIPSEDILFLGYVDSYDFLLVYEEGEFRIYNYQWWSDDSIGEHEDEDWRRSCNTFFGDGDGCLDIYSVEYSVPEFVNTNPIGMAHEIYEVCDDELEDIYQISEDGEPNDKLIDFIASHMKGKVYCYYK